MNDPLHDDLGHGDDDECGPPTERDCVDDALEGVIEALETAGFSSDIAEKAVNDAIAHLLEQGTIDDSPDIDSPEMSKYAWIVKTVPALREHLKTMGMEIMQE